MLTYDNLVVLSIGVFMLPPHLNKSESQMTLRPNVAAFTIVSIAGLNKGKLKAEICQEEEGQLCSAIRYLNLTQVAASTAYHVMQPVFTLRELVSADVLRLCAKPVREHLAKCCRMFKLLIARCDSPRILINVPTTTSALFSV